MTHEEMQRTLEFVLQQQAQFAANIQLLQEGQIRLNESVPILVKLAQITNERLNRLESNSNALESNMAALAAAQTHTNERLSALIDIVREQRNGRSS